jgi:hypothetical protein
VEQDSSSISIRSIYVVLIAIALAVSSGRIATVLSREGDTAFLSANDRSRWCTIAALVENGTYQIDPFLKRTGAKKNRRPWHTIDLVRHRGPDGKLHFYSSKPPLLPTMIAGLYWGVSRVTGMWLSEHPIYLARILLWLVNVPLLAVFLVSSIAAMDRVTSRPWAKIFLASAACFGTMLLPFSVSLNNHLPAATAISVALYVFVRLLVDRQFGPAEQAWWLLAGLAAGFTTANELPSLSMTVFLGGVLLLTRPRALLGYGGGVLLVAAAFFATNWIAHESLRPPYAHRGDGRVIAEFEQSQPERDELRRVLIEKGVAEADTQLQIGQARRGRIPILVGAGTLVGLRQAESENWQLREWDDWYDYPNSYWVEGRRRGVDVGEPSRATYLFHMTFGHYGVFSLTPIWLLMPVGVVFGLLGSTSIPPRQTFAGRAALRWIHASIGLATLVCMAFYVLRPEIDRNYGGVSVCFRWLLWFAPLWLFAATGAAEWLAGRRWGRALAVALLAISVFSVSTSLAGPWQSPWLYRYWQFLGWIEP